MDRTISSSLDTLLQGIKPEDIRETSKSLEHVLGTMNRSVQSMNLENVMRELRGPEFNEEIEGLWRDVKKDVVYNGYYPTFRAFYEKLDNSFRESENAATYLRLASIESQMLKLFYRVVRFNLDGVAFERKRFSAQGRRGSIGKILQKMPTDFKDFVKRVEWWLGLFDCEGIVAWKPVPAAGTSVRCFAHPEERIDRRVTVDWGYHAGANGMNAHVDKQNRKAIIADHYYAALNIASRHPLVGERIGEKKRVALVARAVVARIEEFWRKDRDWIRKQWGIR